MNKFEALGITQKLAKKLEVNGILNPTPIQLEAIPIILQGRDVLGLAQTGTGKTAAFGLPLIQNLAKEGSAPKSKEVKSLILAPTRELAKQKRENFGLWVGEQVKNGMKWLHAMTMDEDETKDQRDGEHLVLSSRKEMIASKSKPWESKWTRDIFHTKSGNPDLVLTSFGVGPVKPICLRSQMRNN